MALATMGMVLFTRVPVTPDYWGHVLPGLLVTGLGLGLIFAPAIASATSGVVPDDAGAASATVNTFQQIGGSIGTALLNTIAVTVTMRALPHHASVLSASRLAMPSSTGIRWRFGGRHCSLASAPSSHCSCLSPVPPRATRLW